MAQAHVIFRRRYLPSRSNDCEWIGLDGSRYYHTGLKRFITQDVVVGGIANHKSLNLYAYCQGDPIGLIDPLGTDPIDNIDPSKFYIWVEGAYMGGTKVNGCSTNMENEVALHESIGVKTPSMSTVLSFGLLKTRPDSFYDLFTPDLAGGYYIDLTKPGPLLRAAEVTRAQSMEINDLFTSKIGTLGFYTPGNTCIDVSNAMFDQLVTKYGLNEITITKSARIMPSEPLDLLSNHLVGGVRSTWKILPVCIFIDSVIKISEPAGTLINILTK